MNQPLLSVIVPCHNCEKYIDRCISSIIEQTYSHLEILLIDDGSTDGTGQLVDLWKKKDSRIKAFHFHNSNGNISRKRGLDNSTADYVAFVDSDDWIAKEMYEDMMNALLSTNSDFVQCSACEVFEDGRHVKHHDFKGNDGSFEIIDRIKGVLMVLEDEKVHSWTWDKIYKKELFNGIEFFGGNDDLIIMQQIVHNASQSAFIHREYYFYFQRSGSYLHGNSMQARLEFYKEACHTRYERYLFALKYPEYSSMVSKVRADVIYIIIKTLRTLTLYPDLSANDDFDLNYQHFRKMHFSMWSRLPKFFSLLNRLEIIILKINPRLYRLLVTILRKHLLRTNI